MPKMKTNKSMKARFRVTGTGKLVRGRPGRRHLMTKKSAKCKRQSRCPAFVAPAQTKMYSRLIGA